MITTNHGRCKIAIPLLLVIGILFCGQGISGMAAPNGPPLRSPGITLSASDKSWPRQTTAGYRAGTAKLPDLPEQKRGSAVTENRLLALYNATPPFSMPATAIAYWGALRGKDPQPWVRRMLLAVQQRGATTTEVDARESLTDALAQVYHSRKAACAVEGLINLNMDGHYQEMLDFTRFDLFRETPEPFIKILSRKSLETLRQETHAKGNNTFTSSLVYNLSGDPKMTRDFERFRASVRTKPTPNDQFLHRYLTMVLQSAGARKQ